MRGQNTQIVIFVARCWVYILPGQYISPVLCFACCPGDSPQPVVCSSHVFLPLLCNLEWTEVGKKSRNLTGKEDIQLHLENYNSRGMRERDAL